MKNINLTQISTFVIAVSMASFFVSADDEIVQINDKSSVSQVSTTIVKETVESVEEVNEKFTFTSLDTDKNGKLSHQEVVDGKNQWLVNSFKKIDGDADKSLTEQELVSFVAKTTATTK